MSEETKKIMSQDWELSDDFYHQDNGKKLSLDDFLGDESEEKGFAPEKNASTNLGRQLEELAEQVRQIAVLSGQGNEASQIAESLSMDEQTVRDIMVCLQAFPGDDPMAAARLILLG